MPESLTRLLSERYDALPLAALRRPAETLVVLLALLLARHLLLRFAEAQDLTAQQRYRWRKLSGWIALGLALAIVGPIWIGGLSNLVTYLGLLSAGLAIALKDPVTHLAGWAFILARKPFAVGDRIEIDGFRGDVVDLRIFAFTMMEIGNRVGAEQSSGRLIHVPNGRVFQSPIFNYSQGFGHLWNEIEVLVTFESDWRRAKAILERIVEAEAGTAPADAESQLRRGTARFLIAAGTLTPKVYTWLDASGVGLTARYLVPIRGRRGSEERVVEALLDALAEEPGIDLAYPTQRLYYNPREGKPRAGGPDRSGAPIP